MAKESSIVFSAIDEFTGPVTTMRNSNKAFNKDLEETNRKADAYRKRQDEITRQMAKVQTGIVAATEAVKTAKKEYAKFQDEVTGTKLETAYRDLDKLKSSLKMSEQAAEDTRLEMGKLYDEGRKGGNRSGLAARLQTSGLTNLVGNAVAQAGSTLIESALGQPEAMLAQSTLAGIGQGAAMGAMAGTILGMPGIVAGGLIGGAAGLVQGGAKVFQAQDDAFKSYNQDQYGAIQERRGAELQGGSGVAAKRETDQLSFSNALGSDTEAADYLTELKTLANTTPFLYDDLSALSKTLLAYGTDKESIIPTLTAVGDTGAAKGMGTEDISTVAVALGRMQSTDKASLEYINLLTERGVGAVDWLAARDGLSVADVYDKISKGKYSGKEVSAFFVEKMNEEFGGMMDAQSRTFAGRGSTLEGWEQEMQSATGEGYNAVKGEGIARQNEYYEGIAGSMSEMNGIIGESKAYLENLNDQYGREAMSALLEGQQTTLYEPEQAEELQSMHQTYNDLLGQYQAAEEEDKAGLGAKIEALKGEAEGMAESAFNASTGMQEVKDVQLELIDALRENTAALGSGAWRTQYDIDQGQSKGMAAVNYANAGKMQTDTSGGRQAARFNRAMGQNTIPYDNFPILAHQGERLLTAAQARAADRGGGDIQVTFTGPVTVREEADLGKLARKFAAEFRRASLLAAPA